MSTSIAMWQAGLAKIRAAVEKYKPEMMATRENAVAVADLAIRAKQAKELVQKKTKEECAEHLAKIDEIKAKWSPFVVAFTEAEARLKALSGEHVKHQKKRADEERIEIAKKLDEARVAREAAEQSARAAVTPIEVETAQAAVIAATAQQGQALEELDQVDSPVRGIRVGSGTVSVATEWTWEIEDIRKVPRDFLQPDRKKITADVKAGTRSIPGLRIYPKESIRSTPKKAKPDGLTKALTNPWEAEKV